MAELITRLQDVKAGDIFLGPIGGLVGVGVGIGEFIVDGGFRVGNVDVRHAGIVTEAVRPGVVTDRPALAQAMPRGAEIVPMISEDHWTDRCLYARLPEDWPGQAAYAASVARAMVQARVAYSFASYPALALHRWTGGWPRLDRWINRRGPVVPYIPGDDTWGGPSPFETRFPLEAICSVFVDQAWTLAGKRVMQGVSPQAVTPSQLARTLIQTDGVTLGWPGLHPFTPAL